MPRRQSAVGGLSWWSLLAWNGDEPQEGRVAAGGGVGAGDGAAGGDSLPGPALSSPVNTRSQVRTPGIRRLDTRTRHRHFFMALVAGYTVFNVNVS